MEDASLLCKQTTCAAVAALGRNLVHASTAGCSAGLVGDKSLVDLLAIVSLPRPVILDQVLR